jgi:hypothetical protein
MVVTSLSLQSCGINRMLVDMEFVVKVIVLGLIILEYSGFSLKIIILSTVCFAYQSFGLQHWAPSAA